MARCLASLDAPLAPVDAHDPCGRALLFARAALLGTSWWVATTTQRPSRDRWFAAVGLGFLASIAVRGLFVPFALLAVGGTFREARARVANLAVAAATVVVVAWPRATPPPDDLTVTDANPAAETALWAQRDNLYRARFWAAQWSAREAGLDNGHLMLARADWALGHEEAARQEAARIMAETDIPLAKAQAAELLRNWGRPPP